MGELLILLIIGIVLIMVLWSANYYIWYTLWKNPVVENTDHTIYCGLTDLIDAQWCWFWGKSYWYQSNQLISRIFQGDFKNSWFLTDFINHWFPRVYMIKFQIVTRAIKEFDWHHFNTMLNGGICFINMESPYYQVLNS